MSFCGILSLIWHIIADSSPCTCGLMMFRFRLYMGRRRMMRGLGDNGETARNYRVHEPRRNTMLLRVALGFLLLFGLYAVSCNRRQESPDSRSAQLVGTWELRIRHSCENYPIRSDILVLHPDGTFDQHTVASDGTLFDSFRQRWAYIEEKSISLDRRRDWDTHVDPSLKGPKPDKPKSNDPAGITELQVLIVQFGSPPVILINPNSDCAYVKTK